MENKEIELALAEPFSADGIEWRVSRTKPDYSSVVVLAYLTNRAIMNRLDEVVGIGNWKNEYIFMPEGGFLCGLSVKIDSEWITKWDGADKTQVEATKGGLSSAMKRAGVLWGIGRYLYELDETKAPLKPSGQHWVKNKTTNKYLYWDNPILPAKFLPKSTPPAPQKTQSSDETPITAAQVTRLCTMLKDRDMEAFNGWLLQTYQLDSKKKIPKMFYEDICEFIEKTGVK